MLDIEQVIANLQSKKKQADENAAVKNGALATATKQTEEKLAILRSLKKLRDENANISQADRDNIQMAMVELGKKIEQVAESNKPNLNVNLQGIERLSANVLTVEGLAESFQAMVDHLKALETKMSDGLKNIEFVLPEPVLNTPNVNVEAPIIELKPVIDEIRKLKEAVGNIKVSEAQKIDIDISPIVQSIIVLQSKIEGLRPNDPDFSNIIVAMEAVEDAVRGLRFPVPTPVTQFDLNPLRGLIKSTAVTVTTTATQLPGSNLANRRGIIIYNNSANEIFIGGSDVTAGNGFPVASESSSPPIDAGTSMKLYGIIGSGTAEIRVLEVANDAIGSA